MVVSVSGFFTRQLARSARPLAVAIVFAVGGLASSAQAAVCPNVDLRNTFEVVPSPECYAYGNGNLTGLKGPAPGDVNPSLYDPILTGFSQGANTITFPLPSLALSDLVLIDRSDTGAGAVPGILEGNITNAGSTGTITVRNDPALAGYTNFVLALRADNSSDPTWAAFLIGGPDTYTYEINVDDRDGGSVGVGNRYTSLYAQAAVIPLPAAAWLLLGGLGGLGLIARRRRGEATGA